MIMKTLPLFQAVVVFLTINICRAEKTDAEWADEKINKLNTAGVAALVARDGKILWQGAVGYADAEKKVPITVSTKFRIGSVSKQFTAAAILKLAEEGKLTLSDPLSKFFPGFPDGDKITIHQLLIHTSGLCSYTGKAEFYSRVEKPITPDELIAWFREDKPDFAPGTGFKYNNSGYFLAGEIVAKVSGKSFEDYLRSTFFEPLGMKNTGIFVNDKPPADAASGFSWIGGELKPSLNWDMSWAGGAGGLYSTVGDLMKWNDALHGGHVLGAKSLKLMVTPNELPPGVDGLVYGYGLKVYESNRLPVLSHGGGLDGWAADLIYFPQQRCTVAVLVNAQPLPPGVVPSVFSHSLAARFLADDIKKLPVVEENKNVDTKTYTDFAGRYDYDGTVMTVSVEGDQLFSQITGQQKFKIFPKSANEFFWKVADAKVVFLRDDTGAVTAAQHTQNARTFRAPRIEASAVKMTNAQLDAILGQYQYSPTTVMTVTRDGEQVFAQLTNQQKYSIHAKNESEFEWRNVAASVRFVAGTDGKITKAVHTQHGSSFDAPKIK